MTPHDLGLLAACCFSPGNAAVGSAARHRYRGRGPETASRRRCYWPEIKLAAPPAIAGSAPPVAETLLFNALRDAIDEENGACEHRLCGSARTSASTAFLQSHQDLYEK